MIIASLKAGFMRVKDMTLEVRLGVIEFLVKDYEETKEILSNFY